MHHIKTAYSTQKNPAEAANDIKTILGDHPVHTLLYFASSFYNQKDLNDCMKQAYPESVLFGCSTAGEIVSGHMMKHSVVVMAFHPETISDIRVEVVENIQNTENIVKAFQSFESHFGESLSDMDYKRYVGIVLMDGMSRAEEKFLDKIGDLTNVTFIGGSAGDDLRFEKTHVYADGKTYENAAVLALIKPAVPFGIIKTQSFKSLGKKLSVTRSNEATREVLQFNGKPAVEAYAESLGENLANIDDRFMTNPLGLMVNGTPFVRSPQQAKDGSMVFYCNMIEGMELEILESTDIISETKKAVSDKAMEMGSINAIINFNCILRTLDLEKKGLTQDYADIFLKIPTIGFSTYGEAYIGHINQTATMLVFG